MDGSFSSTRNDAFPAGLRVLVVDDDPAWLKILEKMLRKCSYEVTTCCLARHALELLRERKDGFDIVISDVKMPDMDGFKLLEHVGLEMDLPVIMMSVDGETSRVMKGVQHGACDYLLKPIRMKELRNIWQHVFRKKIQEVRDIESHEGIDEILMMRNGLDQSDTGHFLSGADTNSVKKRKDAETKHDEKDFGDPSSVKKARVVWTVDLHQKFVKAVNHIGFDKVGPKKILDLMNVPWLTRENVASHLQKYRLYLSRLQKEDELKASFGGIKHSDLSSEDPTGSCCIQNSINMQPSGSANGNYGFSGNKTIVQNVDAKIHEGDVEGIVSLPMTKPQKTLIGDIPDLPKASRSQLGPNHSFRPLEPDVDYAVFDSSITQYSWSGEVADVQFKEKDGFSHLPLPGPQHQIQDDCLQPAPSNPRPLNTDTDQQAPIEIKPSHSKYRSNDVRRVNPVGRAIDLFSVQSESHLANFNTSEQIPATLLDMQNHGLSQTFVNDFEYGQRNPVLGSEPALASLDEDLQVYLLQGDCYTMNHGLQNKEFFDYNNSELIAEVPVHLDDAPRFYYEYTYDLMDYPVIDQGLFIA